ncbi:glycoside hydrolase family 3 C-terminal domain-containing protein [Streptomyces sp. JNUCC 64]
MTFPNRMSIHEKAMLTTGQDFFTTRPAAGIPSIRMADGPYGVRFQPKDEDHLGVAESVPATCFPPGVALAQTWDTDLAERVGRALAVECRAVGVHVLLGPGVNLKRAPLGGRNFEYFSEDPVLTAALGTAWVRGVQSGGVGASLKHFIGNEQETDRQRISSNIAARPLREVYLRAFRRVVEEGEPWTVMSSYNRVNGVYTSEDASLFSILREEWGFDGLVVSDWGGITDRVAAAAAGVDLEMPSTGSLGPDKLVDALRAGRIDEDVLDRIVDRLAGLGSRISTETPEAVDLDDHHELARAAAERAIVLLKNEGDLLPIASRRSIAVIGELARSPRFQGGGSAFVSAARVDSPLDEIRAVHGSGVRYERGYTLDGGEDASLAKAAEVLAAEADVVVLFLGLPLADESEGYDRTTLPLPDAQLRVLRRVLDANPRTVVVLSHGGVVDVREVVAAPAILDGGLLGQGGGRALAKVLAGQVNPSGHLAETVPLRLQDTPSYLSFPGEHGRVDYSEGIFVGHRWYDARELDVAFPFGHGLSYTTFEYGDLVLDECQEGIRARLTVVNSGQVAGRAVPQLYLGMPASTVVRPPRELKAFASVMLAPGERQTTEMLLRRQDLEYWDVRFDRWILEPGTYVVSAGESSRDIRVTAAITLAGDSVSAPLTRESTLAEVLAHPVAGAALESMLKRAFAEGSEAVDDQGVDPFELMSQFPVGRAVSFSQGQLMNDGQLDDFLAFANSQHGGSDD